MAYVIVGLLVILAGFLLYLFGSGMRLSPKTEAIIDRVLSSELPEVVVGETGYAAANGLKIWYETILPEDSPKGVVLLLMSNGADALIWPPRFFRAFAEAGYQVIRYDHRGTGMSDRVENWDRQNPYSIADMAGDAVAVLDALAIDEAHLVGLSMGGMIAQEVAINHPDRVVSLTLMMTSGYVGDPALPGLTTSNLLRSALKKIPLLKYRLLGGERNLIRERIAGQISMIGYEGWDVGETAEVVLYDLRKRRGINISVAFQHLTAVTISGSRYERLRTLEVPTLVVHGTADQLIPIEHGRKLVETISNARGMWLEGVGHVFPVPDMDGLTDRILAHIANR